MRSIGRDPVFVERAAGAELTDVDGNTYVDYVCSWGPLIHGHAYPPVLAAVAGGGRARHDVRRPDRRRGRAGRARRPAHAVGGDAADDLVRHRGVDERDPARARRHRPRHARQVRRRLPRPRRRPARRGGLRARHPGHPGLARRAGGRHRGDRDRARGTTRTRSAPRSSSTRPPRSSPSPTRPTWASSRRQLRLPRAAARARRRVSGALLVFDEVITGFRVAPGGAQELTGVIARPDRHGQGHRRRAARRRLRRPGRAAQPHRARPATSTRPAR